MSTRWLGFSHPSSFQRMRDAMWKIPEAFFASVGVPNEVQVAIRARIQKCATLKPQGEIEYEANHHRISRGCRICGLRSTKSRNQPKQRGATKGARSAEGRHGRRGQGQQETGRSRQGCGAGADRRGQEKGRSPG